MAHLASPLSSCRQHAPQLTAARVAEASSNVAADLADVSFGAPLDSVWQLQQRHNSVSSAGSATTTTAGSAQLSATESCRDELLTSAGGSGGGCGGGAVEADEGLERVLASCTPVMQRRGSRRPRGVFDSNWSVQSELASLESTVVSAQPGTHEPSHEAIRNPSPSTHSAPLGMITFTLLYDGSQSKLEVHVFEGKHLPATGAFVLLNLIPGHGKSRKLKTRTRHKTVDPYWNDLLVYHGLDVDEMRTKTLRLTVKDDDAPTAPNHRRTIGEYRLALSDLPMCQLQRYCVPLAPPQHCSTDTTRSDDHSGSSSGGSSGKESLGKICIALLYNPSQAALHVTIVRCAALIAMDQNGYSDPYVKLYLKPDKSKKSKHKTVVRKKNLNPEFNQDFVYHMTRDELTAKSLQVSVWDYDKVAKNDFIGGVLLGSGSQASSVAAARHWQALMSAPNVKHEEWHKLQSIGKGSSDDE